MGSSSKVNLKEQRLLCQERQPATWRGIDAGVIKCRGSDTEPAAFIALRINLSFMLTQGKIMQLLNAALSEALHIPADPAAAVTERWQEAREDHGIHFKWRQIHIQIISSQIRGEEKVRSYSIIDKIKLEEEPIPSSICLVKLSPKRVKEDLVALTAEHKLRSKEEETTSDLRDDDNLQHWHKNITNMTTSSTNSSEDMRYSEITKSKHTNWSPTISYLVQTFYTCTTIHQHKDQ